MHNPTATALVQMSHVLHVGDVAELLALSPITVQELCDTKVLPHKLAGTCYKIHPRDLAEWIEDCPDEAHGPISEKIADWVWAHVLDRTLALPIPRLLANVLTHLGKTWFDVAQSEVCRDYTDGLKQPSFLCFQQALEILVSIEEQCDLFAELVWLGVYYA